MRGNTHVRFGGRAGETERPKGRHRASVRPYYEKVREGGRVTNTAFLVAIAVNEHGEREVIGCAVAAAESEASWTGFLRSLVARGLSGVRLAISDAHLGVKAAVAGTLEGAAWQRSSGALHPQRPGPRAPACRVDGRLGHQDGHRAARRHERPGAARPGGRGAPCDLVPQGGRRPARGRGRAARALRLPGVPPPPDAQHEPARAAQQGDPGVGLVPAGWTATAARTVGDRAEA
jgi:Transposase, Mutator family